MRLYRVTRNITDGPYAGITVTRDEHWFPAYVPRVGERVDYGVWTGAGNVVLNVTEVCS